MNKAGRPKGKTYSQETGVKVFRFDKDEGYSVDRATSGLNAATTLSVARTWEKNYWNRVIRFWRAQIEFAKKRTLPDDVQ